MAPQVTIVLIVSRRFLLKQIFKRLDELECDKDQTNLLVLVDGDLNIFLEVRKLIETVSFAEKLAVRATNGKPPQRSQVYRRRRIGQLHQEAKQYLMECDLVFLVEDDGIVPKDSLCKLLKLYNEKENVGFVSGIELGRWQSRYIGAWHIQPAPDPNTISSIVYEQDRVIKVDAAGFYCMLLPLEIYERYTIEPTRYYGPDLHFGNLLSKDGYNNYVDTSIVVDHYSESGRVFNLKNDIPKVICMQKKKGIWRFVNKVESIV